MTRRERERVIRYNVLASLEEVERNVIEHVTLLVPETKLEDHFNTRKFWMMVGNLQLLRREIVPTEEMRK